MNISYNNKTNSFRQPRMTGVSRPVKAARLSYCMILSANPARQSMFVQSAADAGWETLTCSDIASAEACLARNFVGLAIVDMDGESAVDFQQLLNRLRLTDGLLSIVCGNEGHVEEEVFVRQLSPWLYLPGVDHGADVTTLCTQARKVTERRQAAESPTIPQSGRPNLRRIG